MAALGELISGGYKASGMLTRVLERSKGKSKLGPRPGDRALARVRDVTREIGNTFRGFEDTVAVFRVLGSLTRIETARLGSAGAEFGNLAEEVTALTMNIEASGQGILEAATRVHQSMQSALTRGGWPPRQRAEGLAVADQ